MKADHKWLEKWSQNLDNKTVLELGCGSGIDTNTIAKFAKTIITGDLNPPQKIESASKLMTLDHSKDLPFQQDEFDVVVASLCLHYFKWSTTRNIVSEISRVLKNQGLLLCRLNSKNDINYGATGYPEIERGLYSVKDETKRFFDESDIRDLFPTPWQIPMLEEKTIDRYRKAKVIWEFEAINA